MSFWDKLWDLMGMFTVNKIMRQDEERIKGGAKITPSFLSLVKERIEKNAQTQNPLPTEEKSVEWGMRFQGQVEEMEIMKALAEFLYHPYLQIPSFADLGSTGVNTEYGKFKNTIGYTYLLNFIKKYGENYHKEDLVKLKQLINSKGFNFTEDALEKLINDEKKEQDYIAFKQRILESHPISLQDYFSIFSNIFNSDIAFFEKHKSADYIKAEKCNDTLLMRFKNGDLIPTEELVKKVFNMATKLYFLKKLLAESKVELKFGDCNLCNDKELFRIIMETKEKVEFDKFEKSLMTGFSITDIDTMEGHEFERFLKTLFEEMSYSVEQTKLTGDQGADLVINKLGEKTVVQAKRSNSKIGNNAIQEVVASISHYKVDKGMVVTNNFFTPSAIELAKSNKITLLDRKELDRYIKEYL